MANYARGAGSVFQIGKEIEYGTLVSPTNQINFLSEGISLEVVRITEESLLLSKTARFMDVMTYNVSGDFSVILKPENIKELFLLTMGVEEAPVLKELTTGVYEHKFLLASPDVSLPSFSAVVNRKFSTPAYTGLKIQSMSLEAKSADYIRGTFSVQGSGKEEVGTIETLPIPTMKAYRFVNGQLTIDGVEFAEVSSVKVDINNQLDEGQQTLGSGYYKTEGEHNEREITIGIDCFYNAQSNTIREEKYKTDGATANIVLTFESPEEIETGEKNRFVFNLPNVVITAANPNVAGREKIELTIDGQALETATQEALEVLVYDGDLNSSF